MIFEFENYTIDVYEEKMKTLAEKKHRCGCPPCCAFREYVHTFSDDVKKLFNELAVPPEKRESIAVVADENGLLILEGIGVDARAAVTKETERIVIVKIKR